jgi:type I restriction enzyme S subunit
MMKKYDSYKDSGVEWIGELPSHWEVKKLKNVSHVKPSNVDKHIFPDEIQVRLCNYTDVYYNDFITCLTELKRGSCNSLEFEKFRLEKGDVIITKDSESPDDIGIPCLVVDDFDDVVCGYHLTLIRPQCLMGGYIFRFIQSDRTRRYFEVHSNGITRYGLGKSSIENLSLPFPPLSEQHQIVSYLDTKTSLIDSLIEKTQRKIELLKEKRTSLINEVVTKGLNPNVEMKDSGVEWIGEIPSHWEFVKYKNLGDKTTNSISVDSFNEVEVIHYSIPNVQTYGKGIKEFGGDIDSSKLLFRGGELIISKLNPRKSCVSIVENFDNELIVGSGEFVVLTPKNTDTKFLFYFLKTQPFTDFLDSSVESVTRSHQRVNPSIVYNTMVPVPPISEQQQIVSYLDEHTQLIDKTISVEERRIDTLKEYRQSLISEVVTGKRKVVTYE